jgi:hypothetical protein
MDTDIGNSIEHIPKKLLVPQLIKKCISFTKPQSRSQQILSCLSCTHSTFSNVHVYNIIHIFSLLR